MTAITLNLDSITHLTHVQFRELCRENRDLRLELTAAGDLMIMSPTGWESGQRNSSLNGQLWVWNKQTRLGATFDSSTGFILPNGAIRSPDAAWVASDRLIELNPDPDGFLPLAPDFLIELRSASDRIKPLQEKMMEYRDNGVRMGVLLNPKEKRVELYLPNQVEVLESPTQVSCEPVLRGFVLRLEEIFKP